MSDTPTRNPFSTFATGFSRVVGSAKVQAAGAVALTAFFTVRSMAQGMPADQAASLWMTFIIAVCALAVAVIGAWAYEDGKEKGAPVMVLDDQETRNMLSDNIQKVQDNTDLVEQLEKRMDAESKPVNPEKFVGLKGLTGIALLLPLMGGCVGTSPEFQFAVQQPIETITTRTAEYVQADQALDADQKLTRQGQIADLRTAAAVRKSIDSYKIESTWKPVKLIYIGYVENDQNIRAETKQARLWTVTDLDALIVSENERRRAWFNPR